MIASRIGRAGTRFGPTRFGGSSSAMIGPAITHSSSGTRQIGGNGSRFFLGLPMLHLLLSRRCSPGASLEIGTKGVSVKRCQRVRVSASPDAVHDQAATLPGASFDDAERATMRSWLPQRPLTGPEVVGVVVVAFIVLPFLI